MKRGNPQTKSRHQGRLASGQRNRRLTVENLETRQLLAAAIGSGGPAFVAGYGAIDNVAPRNIGTVNAFQFNESELSTGRGINDSRATAEFLPLGTLPGQQDTIDVRGNLPPLTTSTLNGTQFEDVDFFRFNLRAGDILDIATTGAAGRFDVMYANGQQWFGTLTNNALLDEEGLATIYPANSPLQTLGNAVGAQIVPDTGTYYLRVAREVTGSAATAYTVGLRVYRPVMEGAPIGAQQTVYIDFEGGLFPTSLFFDPAADPDEPLPSTIQIPSLVESLNFLGFDVPIVVTPESAGIVNTLIDDILRRVEDDFNIWIPATGGNGDFNRTGVPGEYGIRILNSRDHADPGFNAPYVTRVFVGGSAPDIFIDSDGLYGIAQTVDVGNFNTSEFVLTFLEAIGLDAQDFDDIPNSLTSNRLQIAAQGLALTISHELAHSFGIFHTDRAGGIRSIIDAGVDINDDYELGLDGIFGTADDIDMSFPERDRFEPTEGYRGFNRVTASLAWGLATGTQGTSLRGTVFNDANRDSARNAGEAGLAGVTVFVDANGNGVFDPGETFTTTAADGSYTLPVPAGNNLISIVPPTGYVLTTPASRPVTGAATNVTFGLHQPNATFTGRKFADLNGNGFLDAGEPGIGGVFVYIDLDRDGRIDIGEPRAITNADGTYTLNFAGLQPGLTYQIREVVGPGFEQTSPTSGFHEFVYDPLNPPVGLNFANRPSRDFGDAPDSYMTLQASGGPSHGIIPGLSLGQRVDRDLDGQPSPLADGDDLSGPVGPGGVVLDDEDGVRVLSPIAPGATAAFEVTITNTTGQTGYLQAWFDFNKDGTFTGPGEKVLSNVVLPAGANIVNIQIPTGVTPGNLFTRWRYSLTPDLGIGGPADTGEVEDHLFTVVAQPKVANDDVVIVPRNRPANQIFVLSNDFETADNRLRITGRDLVSLGTRGVVTIAPDQRSLFYTPPTGFVGQDRFTYTVTPDFGPPSTATVTVNVTFQSDVPVALDDTFRVAQGSNNIALNVLDNDLPSSFGGITIVSVTPGTRGGATSLVGGNQSVRYTPQAGFAGTEEFTYTISDAAGNISSATATVNLLPGSQLDDVVGFEIEFLDVVNGQPITDIQAGREFLARVTVEDLRQPALNQSNIFSAFLDLLYTDELVAVLPDPSNPLGFAIQFGNQFQSGITGLQSGDASIPGLLDEVGSQRVSLQSSGVAEGPLELFTVRFQAISPGIAVFAANPADEPINETTVYNRQTALAVNELRLGISELVISPGGDSFTSAIDDAFPDGLDSTGARIEGGRAAQLDVLANDLLGPTDTISEFFILNQPNEGVAFVNGGIVVYTPDNAVINRFDSFTYGIVTADGVRSTAEVTLFVGDPIAAQNSAPIGNKPFDVDIALKVVDGNGNQVNSVSPGSRFGVQVIVQDLRAALAANPLGVFAAFTDILYDADLARPSNQILDDPFDFDVQFGPEFGVTGAFGIADRVGIIDEFGSFLTNTNPTNVPPNPALTGQPVLLATLFFDAIGTGELRFASSPADARPFRDTLLFQPAEPVEVSRIRYNVATVQIGSGSGEGETLQNALLPADVNGDGYVTPIDALLVLNEIRDARLEASGESPRQNRPRFFTDVDGNKAVTPMDALLVINHIRLARQGDVPMDLHQLSALTPGANGITPIDSYEALNQLLSGRYAGSTAAAEGEGADENGGVVAQPRAVPMTEPAAAGDDDDEAMLGLLADDVASLWK